MEVWKKDYFFHNDNCTREKRYSSGIFKFHSSFNELFHSCDVFCLNNIHHLWKITRSIISEIRLETTENKLYIVEMSFQLKQLWMNTNLIISLTRCFLLIFRWALSIFFTFHKFIQKLNKHSQRKLVTIYNLKFHSHHEWIEVLLLLWYSLSLETLVYN